MNQPMNMPNSTSQPSHKPPFLRRVSIAIEAFFKILTDGDYATRVQDLAHKPPQPNPVPVVAAVPKLVYNQDAALQLLALLQREARLIDFTQENLSAYSDADIGAAARVVHAGCGKVLREHFTLAPVRPETEGSRITLQAGFDAGAVRLSGNVVGSAPFKGSLSHPGWRATEVRLPTLAPGHDVTVLAQAEVEL